MLLARLPTAGEGAGAAHAAGEAPGEHSRRPRAPGLPSSPALHAALAWAGDTCARELLCPGGTGRVAVLWLKGSAGRPWGGPSERRATGDTWTPHGGRRGAA